MKAIEENVHIDVSLKVVLEANLGMFWSCLLTPKRQKYLMKWHRISHFKSLLYEYLKKIMSLFRCALRNLWNSKNYEVWSK